MNYISIVMAIFSLIAAIDYIIGNKIGIGKDFEKGISFMGIMTLSMTGMLILAPAIAILLSGLTAHLPSFIDPSIFAGSILANDMGGAPLAKELCRTAETGYFNGLIVGSMMGATISFTIPVALGIIPKQHHSDVIFGMICGIITIPVGCAVGGIVAGLSVIPMLINLIPLIIFSLVLAFCMIKFSDACIKIFSVFGKLINILIIVGLASGIFEFLTGIKLIPHTDTIQSGTMVVLNAACVMTGAFPIITLLSRILKKPLTLLGKRLGINDTAAMGLISTLATNVTTFDMVKNMDKKGIVLNSAFFVSAAFTFAGHLAFTIAFNPAFLTSMIVGKLVAGICAVVAANILYKKRTDA